MPENIVAGLFGLSPQQIQQQRLQDSRAQAFQSAQLDPFQRANFNMQQGAGMLAGAGAQALGMQDPAVVEAQKRQALLSQLKSGSPEDILRMAELARSQGDTRSQLIFQKMAEQRQSELSDEALKHAQTSKIWAEINAPAKPEEVSKVGISADTGEAVYRQGLEQFVIRNGQKSPFSGSIRKESGDVSVDVSVDKGDKKYAEERMKGVAEDMSALEKAAKTAYKQIGSLRLFKESSREGPQGSIQPFYTGMQNFLASFGFESKDMTDIRVMESVLGEIQKNMMEQFTARGLTDKDMEVLRSSLPRVATDRASRDAVSDILIKANKSILDEYHSRRTDEVEVYPELSKKIPKPAWYKDYLKVFEDSSQNAPTPGKTNGGWAIRPK